MSDPKVLTPLTKTEWRVVKMALPIIQRTLTELAPLADKAGTWRATLTGMETTLDALFERVAKLETYRRSTRGWINSPWLASDDIAADLGLE